MNHLTLAQIGLDPAGAGAAIFVATALTGLVFAVGNSFAIWLASFFSRKSSCRPPTHRPVTLAR